MVQGPPQQLIETVAERSASAVLRTNADVSAVDICVKKPHAPIDGMFAHVGALPSLSCCQLALPLAEALWPTWFLFRAY